MRHFLLAALSFAFLSGCASFSTTQVEERKANEITTIKTVVKARTLFESKSALSNFKASQTEKTQGASVGSLSQEASGTNAVAILNALAGVVGALPK